MSSFTLQPLSSAPRVPFNLDGRILFSSGEYELIHLTLQPGEEVEIHKQPFDVIFYVMEGCGLLTAGDDRVEVASDAAVLVSAGVMRSWKNTNSIPLRILVNKLFIKP
jgi:mannose-6-phosphate isomerase-like protein (cupin superfamily)